MSTPESLPAAGHLGPAAGAAHDAPLHDALLHDTPAHEAAPAGAAVAPAHAASPPLALIEVLERDGRVRSAHRVHAWPVTLGRAIDNDLVLDDAYVAAHHAHIEMAGGELHLRVLPGKNGVRLGKRTVAAGSAPVALGTRELQAGQTRLKVRLATDALEAERALPTTHVGRPATLLLALALWLWVLAEHAISLDPGSKPSEWLPPLLAAPLAVVLWCLVWALASKIFQHRFDFWPHLVVAVSALLGVEVATFTLQWASALSGWPGFSRLATGATAAIGALALWAHARIVVPQHQRALGLVAAAGYVVGAAILLALNQQRQERWFGELYAHTLPPPALMWHKPTAPEAFVKRIERLRPALEKSAADAAAEARQGGDDDDGD